MSFERSPVSESSPNPVDSVPAFTAFGLHADLMRGINDLGFTRPTQIQAMAIPPLMEGRDVLGAAATGSGKTAAFLLPILHRLMARPRGTTRVLVLEPTRELAAQVVEHMDLLARHTRLSAASVFGGVGMNPQIDAFRRGFDVIVATPGRLLDHMQNDYARLAGLEVLVVDEADRMLDMGFLPDVKRVLAQLPVRRQTMLFSATMPAPIVELSRGLMHDPVALNIHRKAAAAKGITHAVYPVAQDIKPALLVELLARTEYDSVLAFTRTKHRANRLADLLEKRGVACTRIHGNRSQTRRTEALSGFKDGKFRVMVATDIAARGIDIEELALVVNVDVPHVPEDYIHRVGRTARADATGMAITMVSPEEEDDMRAIERALNTRIPRERLEGFEYNRKIEERFEVPIGVRIAEIRARKADERARSREKADRKAAAQPGQGARTSQAGAAARPTQQGSSARGAQPVAAARSGQSGQGMRPVASGSSGRPGFQGQSVSQAQPSRGPDRSRDASFAHPGDNQRSQDPVVQSRPQHAHEPVRQPSSDPRRRTVTRDRVSVPVAPQDVSPDRYLVSRPAAEAPAAVTESAHNPRHASKPSEDSWFRSALSGRSSTHRLGGGSGS